MEKLWAEFRWKVGYWKSRHADAVERIEQLKEEFITLPEESLICPICGKPATIMSVSEASGVLEVDRYSGYKAMTQVATCEPRKIASYPVKASACR